jgi:hypothetical protein
MNEMKRIVILCALLLSGCALRLSHAVGPFSETAITLVKDPLDIRFIQPLGTNRKPILILFATGDGGWRKLDREVFGWISRQGYPVAGFSSSRYLKTMSKVSDTTTPPELAADFARVIEVAEQSMKLPTETKVVMVGISRGAGLASIAAGQTSLREQLAGVIAIALGDVEEHVLHRRRRDRKTEWVAVETYRYLRRLTELPFEIIQSTHDKYTTAARARGLLGADTPLHRLHPIEAASHTFRGAVPDVLAQLQNSLDRLTGVSRLN